MEAMETAGYISLFTYHYHRDTLRLYLFTKRHIRADNTYRGQKWRYGDDDRYNSLFSQL